MYAIKKLAQPAIAVMAMLFLCACATSGPTFKQYQANMPKAAADSGRVFFYRQSPFLGAGSAVQPLIRVDNVEVGRSVPNGFFYLDHAPGTLKITTSTETTEETSLTLEAGQTKYVRTDISMGLLVGRIAPSIIEESQALKEMADTHYTGK
jgi:Protein of unknown function (DUF2846).